MRQKWTDVKDVHFKKTADENIDLYWSFGKLNCHVCAHQNVGQVVILELLLYIIIIDVNYFSLSKDSTSNNARSSSFSSPSTRTTNSLQSNIMSPSRSENELNYIQRKVRKFETNSDVKSPSPRGGSPSPRTGSPSPRGGSPTGLVYAKKYEFSAMPKTDFSYSPTGNQAQSPIHGTAVSNKSNGTDMSVIARGRGYSDAQLHSMTQKLRDEFFRDMSPVRSRSPTPNGRKK